MPVYVSQVVPQPRGVANVFSERAGVRGIEINEGLWYAVPKVNVARARIPVTHHLRIAAKSGVDGDVVECAKKFGRAAKGGISEWANLTGHLSVEVRAISRPAPAVAAQCNRRALLHSSTSRRLVAVHLTTPRCTTSTALLPAREMAKHGFYVQQDRRQSRDVVPSSRTTISFLGVSTRSITFTGCPRALVGCLVRLRAYRARA